ASVAGLRIHGPYGGCREDARLETVCASRGDQFATAQGAWVLRLSRVLFHWWMPRQREEFNGSDHDSRSAKDQESDHLRQCTRYADRNRFQRAHHRSALHPQPPGILPACEGRSACGVYLRKLPLAVAFEIQ